MKKILIITGIIIFISSCENILEENPRSELSANQFFNNKLEAQAGVDGIYSNLRNMFGIGRDFTFWGQFGVDICRPTGGRESGFSFHNYQLSAANLDDLPDYWLWLYKAIGDANLTISRINMASTIDENEKLKIVGEAKFLRAFFYYWLTNFWGDVPMWLDELNVTEIGGEIPRTPVEEVRFHIITDLLDAEKYLPDNYSDELKGKPTKWAAKMLLCKVYLVQEDWSNAKAKADEIIKNSPYKLMENFEDVFGIKNEYNDERIWELDYTQDLYPTNFHSRFTPRGSDEPSISGYPFIGFGLFTAMEEFVNSFNSDDKRLPMYSWKGANGIETNFWYVLKYIDWDSPRANSGMNIIMYRLADAYLMFAEAENELNGPTTEAYGAINIIRERAGVPMLNNLTKEQFHQAVMNERKWELAFENHRRWDLIRWGELVDAVKSTEKTNPQGAANIKSHHMLAPIPPQEIGKNSALIQNPGY